MELAAVAQFADDGFRAVKPAALFVGRQEHGQRPAGAGTSPANRSTAVTIAATPIFMSAAPRP